MALATALPDDTVIIWSVTLAVGLIVALVVVLLLQSLLREVESLTDSVDELWRTAGTVAINTDKIGLVSAAASSVEVLRDEALRHDALLAQILAAPTAPAPSPVPSSAPSSIPTTPGAWT